MLENISYSAFARWRVRHDAQAPTANCGMKDKLTDGKQ